MLAAIPMWYSINNIGKFNRDTLKETLLLAMPAVLIFIIIRLILPSSNNYDLIEEFFRFSSFRVEALVGSVSSLKYEVLKNQPQWLTALINSYRISLGAFGGLILLFLLKPNSLKNVYNHYHIFIYIVFIQLLIAFDNERLLATAYLPVILFTVIILRYAESDLGVSKLIIRAFVVIYFTVQLIATQSYYHETYYAVFYQNIITILFTGYLLFMKTRNKKLESIKS